MSYWTQVEGIIRVDPNGNTQHASTFILNEVLDHLPLVTGSEGPMDWFVTHDRYENVSTTLDEFGQSSNLGIDRHGDRGTEFGWFRHTTNYTITLASSFRDRTFEDTLREFTRWLTRLAKRIRIDSILVRVKGWSATSNDPIHKTYIFQDSEVFHNMYEPMSYMHHDFVSTMQMERSSDFRYAVMPHYYNQGNWCEHLIELMPGGKSVLRELDQLIGYKDPRDIEYANRYRETVNQIRQTYLARQEREIPWVEDDWDFKYTETDVTKGSEGCK